ncbi:MAG: RNA polymerase sigma factor [Nocardioides sp.]
MIDESARRVLVELIHTSGRDVLAALVRVTGDLTLAEDAVQDATLRALERWPHDGIPDNPVAWLRLVARRRAIDLIRREAARSDKEARFTAESTAQAEATFAERCWAAHSEQASSVADDLLRLVFTCCHPSLAVETQVALALRTLCGLGTAEVARALLVPEATMAKRLTRARQKIKHAHIPYRIPAERELPERWAGVLATTYLMFNEGYAATSGPDLMRVTLSEQAIRLARLLVQLRPENPGALGLLGLMLLHDSRRQARVGPDGAAVLLADQDRLLWHAESMAEGIALVGQGLRRSPERPDRYVVQAAIAGCHALSPTYADTDWSAIISWYDVLLTVDPGPVVRLNRAAAIAERDGPAEALRLVDDIDGLTGYPLFHATRAILLRRLARDAEADQAGAYLATLPLNAPQRDAAAGGGNPDSSHQPR